MKTEKHIIKGHFKGKRPHVKVTAYELSTVDCSADKMSGYYSQEATLISDDPEPGYDFAGWSVTGSNVTGNNVRFEGDITAKANYSAHVYNVSLQNDGHGTITADKTTGNLGDTITLSNTPATHYHFSGYSLTGATLTSNQFNIETNDVTAKGWFAEDPKYNLTLQNDGHGSIGAGKTTGYQGDTTTLSNTASANYKFSGYTVTGATLNGSTLTFGAQNATAKAWFSAAPQSALYYSNSKYVLSKSQSAGSININTDTTAFRYLDIKFNYYNPYAVFGKAKVNSARFQIPSAGISSNYKAPQTMWFFVKKYVNDVGGIRWYETFTKTTACYETTSTAGYSYAPNNIAPSSNPYIKYVIDRNNKNFTAIVNNITMGTGTLRTAANVNRIYSINLDHATGTSTSYTDLTISNIRIAGFANFNDATAYNG